MANLWKQFLGPRVPAELRTRDTWRYRLPTALLAAAALLLVISIFLPYWQMTLLAPQYPGGLSVQVYVNKMTGDVAEIDGLNHYIGMRPLAEAGALERQFSIVAITSIALLSLAAIFIHTRWAAPLAFPAATVPFVFLADMYYWLRNFGLNLDPKAPLSSSVKPFVPPLLGSGKVGQFETIAAADWGLYLAGLATLLIIAGLYFHRRAYKPLVDRQQGS